MRVNKIELSAEASEALQLGRRTGTSHCYRNRCHAILLKSEGRYSEEVGKILGMSHNTVNSWLKRYKTSGIVGLATAPGRGRKPLISVELDKTSIETKVSEHRQRVSVAQTEWETEKADRTVSRATFRRFLKELADDTSVFGSVAKGSRE